MSERLELQPGRVYRTREFLRYSTNPTRFAAELTRDKKLQKLRKGLYYAPLHGAFGPVPPSEDELLRAYFADKPYLRSGPSVWNTLGLGTTAVDATPLIYNETRTGRIRIGNRLFELRRVKFPKDPPREFFVIDLLENLPRSGAEPDVIWSSLRRAIEENKFDRGTLARLAAEFGTDATQSKINALLTTYT